MAVLNGIVARSPLFENPDSALAESLGAPKSDVWPASNGILGATRFGTLTLGNAEPANRRVLLGGIVEGLGADFYQGVHFDPLILSLGVVTRQTVYRFRLHNRFLVPISLSSVTPTADTGLTLDLAPGYSLARTQERIVELTAESDGPETIAASYLLTFDVGGSPYSVTLTVTGTRTLVWDSNVHWGERMVVSYAYRTDFFTSFSNKEQRRALRHNPRIAMEFTNLVRRGRLPVVEAMLAAKQNQETTLMDPSDAELTDAFAAEGTDLLSFAVLPRFATVGGLVGVPTGDVPAVYEITEVIGNQVRVVPDIQSDYAAGARVAAIHRGFLAGTLNGRQLTNTVLGLSVRFDALPPSTDRTEPPPPNVSHNGLEVFLTQPNWGETPTVAYEFQNELLDYGRGAIAVESLILFPSRLTPWGFTCKGLAAANDMRNFFDRQYGMRGEFYAPSWKRDFEVVGNLVGGSALFTADGDEVAPLLTGSTVFKRLIVLLNDGTHLIRTVTSMVANGLGGTTVSLDANWPSTITPEQIRMVCWLNRCRLSSDILTLTWLTDSVCTTSLPFLTLEDIDV